MTRLLLTLAAILMIATPLQSAVDVQLSISPRLGGQEFAFDTEVEAPSGAYVFQVTMLRYYLTRITIIHDGGQRTLCRDVVVLVNLAGPQVFDLGSYDVGTIEGIEFGVGVDQAYNHLDPSTYPLGHPLAHQNPSMHWGWTTGYRFCTFEGKAAISSSIVGNVFQIHSVGDQLYKTVSVNVGASDTEGGKNIPLVADYAQLLTNIDVSQGAITHGDFGEAVTLMENFQNRVFSPGVVSSVQESDPGKDERRCQRAESPLHLYPNPAGSMVTITDDMNVSSSGRGLPTRMTIVDALGCVVRSMPTSASHLSVDVSDLPNGVYTVVVERAGGRHSSIPLIKQ